MKKALSIVLAVALMLALVVIPAAAANTDVKADAVLTAKTGGVDVDVKVTGAAGVSNVTFSFAYDNTVFDLDTSKGTFPADFAESSSLRTKAGDGNMVIVTATSADMAKTIDATTATSFAVVPLTFKSGKTVADVNAKVLRIATDAEAMAASKAPAALVMYNGDAMDMAMSNTDGWGASNVTFGKDFDWAPLPLEGVVTVDGTANDGQTLEANITGITTTPAPATYTYQWYRGDDAITGATSKTYTLTADDIGKTVKVAVGATGFSPLIGATAAAVGKDPAKDGKATTIEITSGASILVIPTGDTPATETYEATVKDGYGVAMPDAAVTWSFTDSATPSGATFDPATATLSAAKEIAGGTVKVKVSVNGATPAVEKEIEVLVTSIDFNGKDAVTAKDNLVYGVGWDNIINGISGLSVKVPAGVTGTFSIQEKAATLPNAGTATYHVVFNGTGYTDIPVKDVEVTIAKKPVNVTADDIRVWLNSEASAVEYSYTADALVGEDEYDDSGVTYTLYATNEDGTKGAAATLKTDAVASYFIEVAGVTASANYDITFVDGTLNVKKKNTNPPPIGQGTAAPGTDPGTTTPVENPEFNDVKEGDWFYDSVMAVAKKGLMTGTADKVFSPSLNTTRAQIATILWREAGSPAPRARIADFPDVADNAWYADAVRWCAEQEIVNGFDDGTFRPNDNITREQMVAMMYRYADKTGMDVSATADLADFADADAVGAWAVEYVQWAVGAKLIQGKGANNLDPQGLATRAEVATILQRFVEMGK